MVTDRWSRALLVSILCVCACAQRPASRAQEDVSVLDREATTAVSAVQGQLKNFPIDRKTRISDALQSQLMSVPLSFKVAGNLNSLVTLDPHKLTLTEKNDLLMRIQRTQQLVDPALTPSPAAEADAIISTFQSSSPLSPAEIQALRLRLAQLPNIAKSVGRILWSNPADGNWHFEGTGFVTKTNIVTTACHVISELTDVSDGQLVLRNDRHAVVDFSEMTLPKTGPLPSNMVTYPVSKILAAGSAKGCDVAVVQISGADSVPALSVSKTQSPPKRLLVLGYPQLSDLTPLVCQYEQDPTALYFCQFRTAYPAAAKVTSPGNLYGSNSHDGISVFTYSANTRGGQSGSPVLDFETLQVAGVHYCCTGSADMTYSLGCATWHPQNLRWNEAIASSTVLADSSLKSYFEGQ